MTKIDYHLAEFYIKQTSCSDVNLFYDTVRIILQGVGASLIKLTYIKNLNYIKEIEV